MSDGMPYHLEKGPFLSIAESVVNSGKTERYSILQMLRANKPLTDLGGPGWLLNSSSLSSPYTPTPTDIAKHGEAFMGGAYKAGKFVKKPGMGDGTTGFHNYEGEIESIFRTTFIRAIEVSLGLNHQELLEKQDPARARFWALDYVWKCPSAWVEGWVRWQRAPDGSGHVNVSILIPSHGHGILTKVEEGRNTVRAPDSCECANGMWVITHKENRPHYTTRVDWSEFGVWGLPTFGPVYKGMGPIVTVQISEADGGVKCYGRPYIDPSLTSATRDRPRRAAKKTKATKTPSRARARKG